MNKEQIVINTVAFASQFKRGHIQHEFFESIFNLGIRHVEVRQEYFASSAEFEITAQEAEKWGLKLLYSVPKMLFHDGGLDAGMIAQSLQEAIKLGAIAVKWTRGDYRGWDADSEKIMRQFIGEFQGLLTVENDQTTANGTIHPYLDFLEECERRGIDLYATFDVGNWHWVNEDPLVSARRLRRFVRCIHLKDVRLTDDGPLSVPLGTGQIPLKDVLEILPGDVFTALEYPCGENPTKILAADLSWLEQRS